MRLRSVELQLPARSDAVQFLCEVWGLVVAEDAKRKTYLRGTGDHPYILSLAEAASPAVESITFCGSEAEIEEVGSRASSAKALQGPQLEAFDEPGAARGVIVCGPEKQVFRFVTESKAAAGIDGRDRPIQLTHVVLNCADAEDCTRFAQSVLGFRLTDRNRNMNFVRCNRAHHAVAFVRSGFPSLDHMAFEMADIDAVMRGIGRLKDAGYEPAWGPGRHGPGNNVFGYFVAPFGAVIEYTAEIHQVDDDYPVGSPEDWAWPPNRHDQWGISARDTARLSVAERRFAFR